MKKEYSMYSYGIMGFSKCYNKTTKKIEDELLIMHYGNNKKFIFPKEKAYELICAIQGKQNINGSEFTRKNFNFEQKYINLIDILNARLKGRVVVMVTQFKNAVEYINGIQNAVVGITGLDNFGCKPIATTEEELFKDGFANYDSQDYCTPPEEAEKENDDEITYDA